MRPMNPVLDEMLRSKLAQTPDGRAVPLQSNVQADEAAFLERVVRESGVARTVEIGLAMGCSALAIAEGARSTPQAHHVIVDPRQHARPLWDGIGLHQLARAGFADRVEFVAEPSYRALAALEAAGRRFDFAFIDGFHTFDYTLVDFFLVDRMLEVGGLVAFDDADWSSVSRVVRYVATNRAYTVHAAMPPRREAWSPVRHVYEGVRTVGGAVLGAAARLPGVGRVLTEAVTPAWRGTDARLGLGGPCVVFRKTSEDARRYDHHVDF